MSRVAIDITRAKELADRYASVVAKISDTFNKMNSEIDKMNDSGVWSCLSQKRAVAIAKQLKKYGSQSIDSLNSTATFLKNAANSYQVFDDTVLQKTNEG